jgi:hypothetical protein
MERLNPFWFYHVGAYLGNLKKLPSGTTVASGAGAVEFATLALRTIADGKGPIPLPKCRPLARDLSRDLHVAFSDRPGDSVIADDVLELIVKKVSHIESTMAADVGDLNVFQVRPLAIYNTVALLERAEGNLNNAAQDSLSETTRRDLREAGACLAFHQFTAAGFHSLRAVEAEARRYYKAVTGRRVGVEMSFGKVASQLSDQYTSAETKWVKGGKKGPRRHDPLGVIALLLLRINGIFRNPIMHPEMTLDGDRALEVFGLGCRVISAIAEDINVRKNRRKKKATR